MSDHQTTQELIQNIETMDRRYRRASTMLLVFMGLAIAVTLALQYRAIEEFRNQSAERAEAIKQLQEDNKAESEKTNRYLQCIAEYFAANSESAATLKSLDDCTIDAATGAAVPGVSSESVSGTSSSGQSATPAATPPADPETNPDPNPDPPLGLVPRVANRISNLIDSARGMIGL